MSIIQWRHDAFPRYLTRAFPFYLSVFLLIGAFFTFVVAFLFTDFNKDKKGVVRVADEQPQQHEKDE